MRTGVALLLAIVTSAPALAAFDASKLPPTCQDTLAEMQSDKGRFAQMNLQMGKYRKSNDVPNFCNLARQTVLLIKSENSKLEYCLGDLANATDVPAGSVDQITQLRAVYQQMLDAAKDAKNDKYQCGLAGQ